MKRSLRTKLVSFTALIFTLLFAGKGFAQMVGDNVFLQGAYVEVGIAPNGGYGSTRPAPTGYHPNLGPFTSFDFWDPAAGIDDTSSFLLGFVADYGRDGWDIGAPPFYGDYYLPGTPQEGWAIEIGGVESDAYIPAYWEFSFPPGTGTPVTGYTGNLSGTNIGYSNSGGLIKGVWQGNCTSGTTGNLLITQTTTIDTTKLFFTIKVVLKNTGGSDISDIYYIRTVDPDNDETNGGGFATDNTITDQLPNPEYKVLVSAVGTLFSDNYLGLGTKDCRAKCMIFEGEGLTPVYPLDEIYNETSPGDFLYGLGDEDVEDVGIGLIYNIGTIPAGDSTSLTYCYILNAAYIDSALDATQPTYLVNGLPFRNGDTINTCDYGFDTAVTSIINGDFYQWTWAPDTFSTTDHGTYNVIYVDSIHGTLTYTLTGINLAGGCDTQKDYLTFIHGTFSLALQSHDTDICVGDSVQAHATGSSTLLHYQWYPSTGVSNDTILNPWITPTATTTYTITATPYASSSCPPNPLTFTISVFTPPVLTTDSSLVKTCVGIPVPLHVYASPSSGVSYTYNWSPPTYLDDPTVPNPVTTPLSPGDVIYNITVTPTGTPYPLPAGECSSAASIDVHTEPNDFTLTNRDTTICIGQQIIVSIIGSNAFTYAWTPPNGVSDTAVKNPIITPTSTTDYTVTATYAACPAMIHDFNITVDVPAAPITFSDTICLGMSDTFNVKAADTSIYYQYTWTPGVYLSNDTISNPIFTPLVTGPISYTVNVVPPLAAGCATQDFFNVIVLPNAISITTPDTAICLGSVVQINAVGNPLFNYQWTPTAGIELPQVLDPIISPDTSAEYVISGGFHRCPLFSDSIHIDVQPIPSVYIGGNRSKCADDTMHVFGLINPGWYTNYAYHWSPGANFDDSTMLAAIYNSDTTAEIYLTVTTPIGCSGVDSATIFVNPNSFATITPLSASICPGDSILVTLTGGTTYQWIPVTYVSDTNSSTPVLHPITSQDYAVIARSAAGCLDTLSLMATVYPAAVLDLGDSVTLYPGETYHIEPTTNCTSFAWFPPLGLSDALISDPTASPDVNTKYIVRGVTENGCVVIDSISIYVDPNTLLAMPNAFTPGNGPNNEIKILKRGIATLNYYRIFNRWGNKVFETSDIDKGWDGNYNGTPQPLGVYVYEIQAVTKTGKIFVKQGNITLLR